MPDWAVSALSKVKRGVESAKEFREAVVAVSRALEESGATVDRRDEPAVALRRHPAARLRGGAHTPLADVEILGLVHGERMLSKRMCPPGVGAERSERFRAQGFAAMDFGVTRHGASDGTRDVVLVARDAETLEHGRRVEEALVDAVQSREDDSAPVRDMGALLGYPACCIERFVSLRARDDASLAGALLGRNGELTPFETAFTVPPFTLVSHAPCSPSCAATLSSVSRLLAAMPALERASYERLADARWAIDDLGRILHAPRAKGGSGVAPEKTEWVRVDPSDRDLTEMPISPEDQPVDPLALHWCIETFLSVAPAVAVARARADPLEAG